MIRCAILGAKGYTGCELIKILLRHPEAEVAFLGSRDAESLSVSALLPNEPGAEDLFVEQIDCDKILEKSDVIFLALPHTKSISFVERFHGKGKVIIDLSADYRFTNTAIYEEYYGVEHTSPSLCGQAVYGLPELCREKIAAAELIANPGCYPTAVLLGLLPLAAGKCIDPISVIVDAKSGASGAGRKVALHTQFCELHDNFYAYKVNRHQHAPEMAEILKQIDPDFHSLMFVPHLLPVNRGILATHYATLKGDYSEDDIRHIYDNFYKEASFVRVRPEGSYPQLKDVRMTNYCDIGFCVAPKSRRLIVVSAIDNLLKGASGQAVQNMNVRFGLSEKTGLV